jgi:hypothetical protein
MRIGGAIVGGALAGFLGAMIWAGISYFTGFEIGWIAWGIGGMVGLGCVWGGKGSSNLLGLTAVVITLLSILAGKYAAVELSIRNEIGSEEEVLQNALAALQDDEVVVSYLADEIIEEQEARGETIKWPSGVNPEETSHQQDYPPAIWSKAASRWKEMPPEEQEEYREQLADQVRANVQAFMGNISSYGFLYSFGLMDLLFFGLAVTTAFKIAARGSAHDTGSDVDTA